VRRTLFFRAFGLIIASNVNIPGAIPLNDTTIGTQMPDVHIEQLCALDAELMTRTHPYSREGEQFLFCARGVALYRFIGDSRIIIEPAAHAVQTTIEALLIATALPALLWIRGHIVLHAAAAILPGRERAVAIMGKSGIGKSTVLDQLVIRGATVVADDSVCVAINGDHVTISGLAAGYFIHEDTQSPRTLVRPPASQSAPQADLAALFILERRHDGRDPSFEKCIGAQKLEGLLNNRHRPGVLQVLGTEHLLLSKIATLATHIPIFAWHRMNGQVMLTSHELEYLDNAA